MKMVFAMLFVFVLIGACCNRINRWTITGMAVVILGILVLTRLSF